jgi:uridine kinase
VRRGERQHIFPFQESADKIFDSSLIYEFSVLKIFADRYLLEVPRSDPSFAEAFRLRQFLSMFVPVLPGDIPQTSLLREFIGGSGFSY